MPSAHKTQLQKRRGRPPHTVPSLSPDSESHPCSKIYPQSRISHHFLVLLIQSILHVYITRDSRGERIPAAEIDACISGRMIDIEAQKIRIRRAVPQNFRPDLLPIDCPNRSTASSPNVSDGAAAEAPAHADCRMQTAGRESAWRCSCSPHRARAGMTGSTFEARLPHRGRSTYLCSTYCPTKVVKSRMAKSIWLRKRLL